MARTKGAVSNVSVKWQDLVKRIPADYEGFITVGAKWLANFEQPDEETVQISRDEYLSLKEGVTAEDGLDSIQTQRAVTIPNGSSKPKFSMEG